PLAAQPGDDSVPARRAPGCGTRPQAGAARALRLARAADSRQPRGARGRAGDPRQARAGDPPPAPPGELGMARGEDLFGDGVELFVLTGSSGAGKSEAMAAFEDAGFFCVDNLPPRLIASLGELFVHGGSKVRRAAVVTDVRGGEYFDDLLAVLDELRGEG